MSSETYTFSQCYKLLNVDNKTFRSWLEEAGIDPDHQVSRADRRIRFLTREQLEALAIEHGRLLGSRSKQEPTITPATFKLLADRVARSEDDLARVPDKIEENKQELLQQSDQQHKEMTERYQTIIDQLAQTITLDTFKPFMDRVARSENDLDHIPNKIEEVRQALAQQFTKQQEEAITYYQTLLSDQLGQAQAHSNEQFKEMGQRFAALVVATMKEHQENLDKALTSIREELQTMSTTQKDQGQHLDAIAQALTKLVQRVNLFETTVGGLKTAIDETKALTNGYKTRADDQDRRIEELKILLLEEIGKREALEHSLTKKTPKTNGNGNGTKKGEA